MTRKAAQRGPDLIGFSGVVSNDDSVGFSASPLFPLAGGRQDTILCVIYVLHFGKQGEVSELSHTYFLNCLKSFTFWGIAFWPPSACFCTLVVLGDILRLVSAAGRRPTEGKSEPAAECPPCSSTSSHCHTPHCPYPFFNQRTDWACSPLSGPLRVSMVLQRQSTLSRVQNS